MRRNSADRSPGLDKQFVSCLFQILTLAAWAFDMRNLKQGVISSLFLSCVECTFFCGSRQTACSLILGVGYSEAFNLLVRKPDSFSPSEYSKFEIRHIEPGLI